MSKEYKLGAKDIEITLLEGYIYNPFYPKKVYVLMAGIDYSESEAIGVYTTLKAVEKAKKSAAKNESDLYYYFYNEVDLIE